MERKSSPVSVELAYGRRGLELVVPTSVDMTVIRKPTIAVPPDPAALVHAALAPLADAARGGQSACILVCDITRPVPNGLFLRPMIERLVAGGIPLTEITVLVATGLHRPNVGDELAELIGDPWVLANVAVANHDARDDDMHVMMGTTSRLTPVGIDRRFVDADVKIATGLVEPHFMAGYSGGRKVIAPGVAHHTTIRTFHSARFMEDPSATSCNLTGNPLHEEQLEILAMLGGPIYALNTVIDEDRNPVYVNFGEVVESHAAAVTFARQSVVVEVPHRFSTVVTSAAGFPLDSTYYQTVKAMVTPLDILEPGGTLIVASECSEGMGSEEFVRAQSKLVALGPDGFLDSLVNKSMADVDEWQTEMQLKALRQGQVVLFGPGLSDADHLVTGVQRSDDLALSVSESAARSGDTRVAVIPEGPYVIPKVAEA